MTVASHCILNPNHVAFSFKKVAKGYEESAWLSQEIAMRMMERLDVIKLNPKNIIDVGASTGFTSRLLEKRYPKANLFVCDLAEAMVKNARERARWWTKQRFICANALKLPFKNQSMDLLFANLLLHWCFPLTTVFQEWHRVLKPGGLLVFSTYGMDTLSELRKSWQAVDAFPHIHPFFDILVLGDALMSIFNNPVLDVDRLKVSYPKVQQLMQELKAWGAKNQLKDRRKGLTGKHGMGKMIATYEKEFHNAKGEIIATFEVIYGHAWCALPSWQKDPIAHREARIPLALIQGRKKIKF
jgi:malonyl-CoA O-methyltransferase